MIIKIKATKIHFCFIRLNLESYSRGSFRCFLCLFVCFFKIFLKRSFCLAILQRGVMAVTVNLLEPSPIYTQDLLVLNQGYHWFLVYVVYKDPFPLIAQPALGRDLAVPKSHCALFVESFLRSGPGYDPVSETSC